MTETFFIPSKEYKELMILNMISENSNVTQRELSKTLSVSTTMVNNYIDNCEELGLLKRTYYSTKTVKYTITIKGEEKRKLLNIEFLKSSMNSFKKASTECMNYIDKLISSGYKNILFYGAGEVGEILLYALNNRESKDLNVLAIIDDDINKIGKNILSTKIISIDDIFKYDYDGILISSYTNKDIMISKLKVLGINDLKIIKYL